MLQNISLPFTPSKKARKTQEKGRKAKGWGASFDKTCPTLILNSRTRFFAKTITPKHLYNTSFCQLNALIIKFLNIKIRLFKKN